MFWVEGRRRRGKERRGRGNTLVTWETHEKLSGQRGKRAGLARKRRGGNKEIGLCGERKRKRRKRTWPCEEERNTGQELKSPLGEERREKKRGKDRVMCVTHAGHTCTGPTKKNRHLLGPRSY